MVEFAEFDSVLATALSGVLPDMPLKETILAHATGIMTVLLIVFILLFLFINFFFDFITDVWKIPLAAIIDVLFYFSISASWLALLAAVLGGLLFCFIGDSDFWKFIFATAMVIIGFGYFFFASPLLILLAVLPLTTVFMFIDVIVD